MNRWVTYTSRNRYTWLAKRRRRATGVIQRRAFSGTLRRATEDSSRERDQDQLAIVDAHPEWRAVRHEAHEFPVAHLAQVPDVQDRIGQPG
jgi:hypothetical protein